MSSNPDDDGVSDNNNKCNNNDSVRPKKLANDNLSLKSETCSKSRPLKLNANDNSQETQNINEDQINNNLNTEEILIGEENDKTIAHSSRFSTLRQCTNESQDEKTPCCANLAFNLYNKALESAKRALPKAKPKPVFPRSFGEDFESLGPDGFHYLDDAQTECSYDYKDIEFTREIFRPETQVTNNGTPIVVTEETEPSDMEAMRERYGLPEDADRVQKYDPKKAQILDEKSETEKEEEINPKIVVKSEQKPLKSEKNPVKKKPDKPKRFEKTDLKSEEMKGNSENGGLDEKSPEFTAAEVESGVIIRNKKPPKYVKPPEIEIEMCDSENVANDRTVDSVDQLANRTSLIILDDAIQLAVKSKMDSQSDDKKRDKKEEKEMKKASIENEKQLKKQQKELEKRLKKEEKKKEKEEKSKRKVEKLDKEWEKKERKQLFSRFKSEDKQKKQIMKKTKEFEKMKREKEMEKIKLYGNENPVEVLEASDEEENGEKEVYEKSFVREDDRPYEDIDPNFDELFQKSSENPDLKEVKPQVPEIPSVKTDSNVVEDVVKVEYVEGIQEIGVTYIPSIDGIENENFVEEHEEVLKKKKTKPKSRVSSFKMPKMNALKSKVMDIFPKNKHKVEKNIELQNEESINDSPHAFQCKTEIENERTIILNTDLPKSPNTEVKFVSKLNVEPKIDLKPDHEYENVIESEIEVKEITPEIPEIVLNEVQINDIVTDEEEKNIKEEILISTQNIKNKKKKKSKTRAKLDRFKAKAIESLPKMSSFKTRVKDLLPRREPNQKDLEYERFISDHESYNQRMKYPESDGEAVSDSELCDSLHRNSAYGRQHVYEEMAATQERLDAYMTPISGPLRPPRRFSSLRSGQKVASVPALSTQVLLRPKRIAPPRPPPPRPPPPMIIPVVQIIVEPNPEFTSIDLNENSGENLNQKFTDNRNDSNSLKRKTKQRVPANIYYNNIRLNYKPKRRFVNLKSKYQLLTYDRPKSPISLKNGRKQTKTLNYREVIDKNNRNLSLKYNTMPVMDIKLIDDKDIELDMDSKYPNYEDIEFRSRAPRPPPRRRRRARRSQTMDALYWRPFSWKSRRCRSMTELDVRRKDDLKPNYENVRAVKPPRPPPPSGSILSVKAKNVDNYQLYASVSKGSKIDISKRPLPPPPVPPRPKCMSISTVSSSVSSRTVSRSYSPTTRDASVSTKDNGLIEWCEKETQCVNDSQLNCDLNGNLEEETATDVEPKTPTNAEPLTPTTPTPTNSISDIEPNIKECIQRSIAEQNAELSDSTVTLSSLNTTTSNYFDAEDPEDPENWDEDTLNDDISSITSNYQSFSSDVTITSSKYDSAPNPELPIQPSAHKSGKRSQSFAQRHPPQDSSPRPPRRSLPENRLKKIDAEEADDTDDLLDLTRDLQSELKQILDRRSKLPQRLDSTNSSNASLHEPIDSSSDGDDYSLSSANEQSPEFLKRRQQQKLYFIAKELYSSEEIFVDVLHLLNCDFRSAVAIHLPEEVLSSILKFLPQLQQINEQLLSELKSRIDNWANHQRISDVLVKICPFLKQYSLYIRDFETISANYDEALRRYPSFMTAVKEFESTPRCKKLSVKHFMLKPVQRLPQYRLLLQDYLRHLKEDSEDYLDTISALNIVSEVAEHANNTMKLGDNVSKLLSIQNSIIGGNEIIKPGRLFIKEGELMKLSRKGMQERWFILFNDSLMYLTPVQNGVYRVNHELSLTGMRVSLPNQQDFQNEFSVISHTRSFSLAARSPKEREEWVTALNKAIQENANKRISFAKSGSNAEELTSPLQMGNCAPVWIPDARVTMCQLCTSEFSVTFRRHHCRCCGKVVCSACSANKAPLPYLKNRNARVCDECYNKLRLQLEEIEKQVQEYGASSGEVGASASESDDGWSLNSWRQQFVRNLPRSSNRKAKIRYVPSVLKEVCANDEGSLISGYLHIRESKRNWKRYWFVIKDLVLYTYKASEDVAALKSLPLLGFKVESLKDSVDGIDHKSLFQLSHPGQPSIIFRAETIGSAERWFKSMQEATTLE